MCVFEFLCHAAAFNILCCQMTNECKIIGKTFKQTKKKEKRQKLEFKLIIIIIRIRIIIFSSFSWTFYKLNSDI